MHRTHTRFRMPSYMQVCDIPTSNKSLVTHKFTTEVDFSKTYRVGTMHIVALTNLVQIIHVEDTYWTDKIVNILEVKEVLEVPYARVQDTQDLARTAWLRIDKMKTTLFLSAQHTAVIKKLIIYLRDTFGNQDDTVQINIQFEEKFIENNRVHMEVKFLEDMTKRFGGNLHYSVLIDFRLIPMNELGDAILYGIPFVDITESKMSQIHDTAYACVNDDNVRAIAYYVLNKRGMDIRVTSWELEHSTLCTEISSNISSTKNHDDNSHFMCVICQERDVDIPCVSLMPCKHVFHSVCMAMFLSNKLRIFVDGENEILVNQQDCPICRAQFSNVQVAYANDLSLRVTSEMSTRAMSVAKTRADAGHAMVLYMLRTFKASRIHYLTEQRALLFAKNFIIAETVTCFASSLCNCLDCSKTCGARFVSDNTCPEAIKWLANRVRAHYLLVANNFMTSGIMFKGSVIGPWNTSQGGAVEYAILSIDFQQAKDGRPPGNTDCVIVDLNTKEFMETTIGTLLKPSSEQTDLFKNVTLGKRRA